MQTLKYSTNKTANDGGSGAVGRSQQRPNTNNPRLSRSFNNDDNDDDNTEASLSPGGMIGHIQIEGGPLAESAAAIGQKGAGGGALPRRGRMGRRASTGGFSAETMMIGAPSNNLPGPPPHVEEGGGVSTDDPYGYGYEPQSPSRRVVGRSKSTDESLFSKAMRRGSMTREQSQLALNQSLEQVSGYKDYADRDDKVQLLKERFQQSKPNLKPAPRRPGKRRSSISSYQSQESISIDGCGIDNRSRSDSVDGSIDFENLHLSNKSAPEHPFNMSSETIPVANVARPSRSGRKSSAKTDQIVESLVWFSFHTPRTVLEDLITHEIELWRREAKREKARLKASKKKKRTENIKMSYMARDDEEESDDSGGSGSVSTLSDDGRAIDVFSGNLTEKLLRQQGLASSNKIVKLPKYTKRESALLFVDMSGFTKLSTLLDVESLSKVINSYFDMIVSEVLQFGGDILKFAGDAFFAEWRVMSDGGESGSKATAASSNPLTDLNASLASLNDITGDDDVPQLSTCVLAATKCAASIVEKFSDYQVMAGTNNTRQAMLNVHCGVGCGSLVGLHVGDYKEGQEEEGVELRREFLLLGSPIDQVRIYT